MAPGIYFLGAAGVLRVGPLRIAGISGSFASGRSLWPNINTLEQISKMIKPQKIMTRPFQISKLEMQPIYIPIFSGESPATLFGGDYFRGRHECPPYTEEIGIRSDVFAPKKCDEFHGPGVQAERLSCARVGCSTFGETSGTCGCGDLL